MKWLKFKKTKNQITKDDNPKYTLKQLLDILITLYDFDKSIQTLRKHIKKLNMPIQEAGRATPTYSNNDFKKLVKHFNLEKIEKIQPNKPKIPKIYEQQFREYLTNLKIDWLFDNIKNSNANQPKINKEQLLKDLKKLDKLETYPDTNDPQQQSKKIELFTKINDYHNYIN